MRRACITRQQTLADRLGLTSSAISYLKRKKKCTLDLALAAAEITGKPISWFLYGEERPASIEAALMAQIAQRAGGKSAALASDFNVAEAVGDYDLPSVRAQITALKARLELLERYYDTFATWMRVVETRLREIEKKEGANGDAGR